MPAGTTSPLAGGTSGAATPPTAAASPSASASPSADADAPDLVAIPPETQVRLPWIEPAWLVVPLVLVPLLAAVALLLLRRLIPRAGRHRRV